MKREKKLRMYFSNLDKEDQLIILGKAAELYKGKGIKQGILEVPEPLAVQQAEEKKEIAEVQEGMEEESPEEIARKVLVKQMKYLHQYSLECNAYEGLPEIAKVLKDLVQLALSL